MLKDWKRKLDILELFGEAQASILDKIDTTLHERARHRNARNIAWVKRNRKRINKYERERRARKRVE
jgi:hypothetical protein